jgi:hypothetical protein
MTWHKGKGPHRQCLDGGGVNGVDGWRRQRSDTRGLAVTRGNGGALKQRRWHVTSDHNYWAGTRGEATVGDGHALSASDTERRPVSALWRGCMRSCRPSATHGMPGGGSALTSGPGTEGERLTGGTPRQILF